MIKSGPKPKCHVAEAKAKLMVHPIIDKIVKGTLVII